MNRELIIIASIVFVTSLFTRSVDPVVPLIADGLVVQVGTAALLSTAFALPYALIQPVLGALGDMMSKTKLMSISLVVLVLSAAVSATAPNFTILVLSRIAAGIASGGIFPISLATIGDRIPVAQRQIAISRMLAATMCGNLLGASLAGVVGDIAGWRAVFVVTGLLGLIVTVAALIGFRKVPRETPPGFDLTTIVPNYRAIFANPHAKVCFGAVFLESLVVFGVFPHMAAMMQEAGETRASIAGIVLAGFGIGGVTYTMVVTHLVRHVPVRLMMLIGGCGMGLGLALIALQVVWPFLFAIFFMQGFALYLLHGPIQVVVTELAPAARSSAAALHSVFFISGQAAGPLFYRFGFDHFGEATTLLIGALAMVFAGAQAGFFLRSAKAAVKT